MIRRLALAALLIGTPQAARPARADAIDDAVEKQMAEQKIPGLALAVARKGETLKRKAYGLANVELKAPATPETVFEIGSITKSFTATAAMKLVEEGKLDLDAPISSYLSDLPEAWKDVTVRHLLNHTSGIKSYTSVGDFLKIAREDLTPSQFLKMIADKPMDFEPGAKWAYNNSGYYLLGMIVEKAAGRPLARELSERVLKPLEMGHTQPSTPSMIIPNRAAGYGKFLTVLANRDPLNATAASGAGFLVSDVDDMLKWGAAQTSDTLLTSASRQKMTTATKLNDDTTHPYGFGWAVGPRRGHRRIDHGGGTSGFSTLLSVYPDDELVVVVLSNLSGAELGSIERAAARQYLPDLDIARAPKLDDPQPEVTGRIRKAIEGLLKGEVDEDELTPDFAKFLATESAKAGTKALAARGDLEELDLIGRETQDGRLVLSYRARFGPARHVVTATLNDAGKIAGLRAERDE